MGIAIRIGSYDFNAETYEVSEDATPIAAGDSSGSVGTISFDIPKVDEDLFPNHDLVVFGPDILEGEEVSLRDSAKGYTLGTVVSVSDDRSAGLWRVECLTRIGKLLAYGVQAQPFSGTLRAAVQYYLSLAGVTTQFTVEDDIALRPVVFPGWYGELWHHFKELALSQDCDVSLVSGVLLVRALRKREAISGRDVSRSKNLDQPNLARAVEVYQYNNRPIENEMVYPPGGWMSSEEVFNVEAGGVSEYTLELSASVSSITQPKFKTTASRDTAVESEYTITADDGTRLTQQQWERNGGALTLEINADTTSLTLRLAGPVGVGNEITSFNVALNPNNDETQQFPSLRIFGSGVEFRKEKLTLPTAVPPSETPTDVGVTIDNPFISTRDDACRAGSRAARQYSGINPALSGTVVAINQRNDLGQEVFATYDDIQDVFGFAIYDVIGTYGTYRDLQDTIRQAFQDDDVNQIFGNVQGTRVWDSKSRRWYRIRTGRISPGEISFEAEDDLLFQDAQSFFGDLTYNGVAGIFPNKTYKRVDLAGLYRG